MADLLTSDAAPVAAAATAPTPEAPDPYQDHQAISALIKQTRDDFSIGREPFVRAAYRNILFKKGHQWILWDRGQARFRPARLPVKHPQPVTNRYKSTLNAMKSVFARIEPRLNFRPGSDEPEDRATADVSSRAIEVVEDEVSIRVQRQHLASWVSTTHGAWLETGYDPDPIHGTRFLPHQECLECGMVQPSAESCMTCGGPELRPAVNQETGEPLGEQVPIGKMYVDVVPLFELWFNPAVTDWSRQRKIQREKLVPPDEAKARWPGHADSIAAETSSGTLDGVYAEQLPTLGTFIGDSTRRGLDAPRSGSLKHVVERWHWQMPDATYPKGLLAIALGRQALTIVHAGPLPYRRKGQQGSPDTPFLPFVQFAQELVEGSAYPGGVADDLAAKQAQRNRWESIIETAAMGFGLPKWTAPEGANIAPGSLTGEADVIRWNPLAGNGAKPERIAGQPINNSFIAYLEKIDQDFEEIAATYELMKGARPEGVSAGIALQILQERGMSRHAPLFILWEAGWAQWASQALEIFRQFATEPRLRRIQGKDGAWQVQKFLGADLKGRVDVVAEANSSLPRSTMAERAEIEQLVTLGILNTQDPETRYEILQIHGKTSLIPGLAADTKNALMESEQFEALAQSPAFQQMAPEELAELELLEYPQIYALFARLGVPLPRLRASVDDHGIHAREQRKWLKSETAMRLPMVIQVLAEKHVAYHDLLASQQMQAVLQAKNGMGRRAGDNPGNPGGPNQSPMRTGSSGKRMMGDNAEMGRDMAAAG